MLRAAVLQAGSIPWDTPATLEKLRRYALDAAAQGVELLVYPEALIGGYPKGLDFGARVGSRTAEGRAQFRRYAECALISFDEIGSIAREAKLWMTGGVIERDGGTLYCTVTYHAPDGSLKGKHRKVMPTAMERVIWGFGDGSTLKAVETPWGNMAAAICWENYMPQLRLSIYSQNVVLYCAPTVDERETWQPSMRHIAAEGRCFVLSAVQYLEAHRPSRHGANQASSSPVGRADSSPLCASNLEPGEWGSISGGSVIVNPLGEVIAGPLRGQEGLLIADIDPGQTLEGKFDLDVVGHYARPDLFPATTLVE